MHLYRLAAALDFAADAHGDQTRKGTTIPYLSHVLQVAGLVLEFGGDESQAIAGLLHDVVEDRGAGQESALRELFDPEAVDMIMHCTDGVADDTGAKPPWRIRKETYLTHLRTAPLRALLVSACDKLHNARSIGSDVAAGRNVFARFSATREQTLWYYDSLVEVFACRFGPEHPLVRELADAVWRMKAPAGTGAEDPATLPPGWFFVERKGTLFRTRGEGHGYDRWDAASRAWSLDEGSARDLVDGGVIVGRNEAVGMTYPAPAV